MLKNVEKIEEISTPMERRIEYDSRSWQHCRILRRDFDISAAKMYKLSFNSSDMRAQINDLLIKFNLQATEFKAESKSFGRPGEIEIRTLPLRVISTQTSSLFAALRLAD